jgi:putative hydrolase of the HAD superfamily
VIEFVFFDVGETLLSPDPSWSAVTERVLRERGHDIDGAEMTRAWREVGPRFRSASDEGIRFSLDAHASRSFWVALYHELLGQLGVSDDEAPEILYRTFSDPRTYRLFPDARDALDTLRGRGRRLGIISNFESWLEDMLARLGILEDFEVIAISGHLGVEKPDPGIFEWAVERAGVPAGSCVHIGDQPFFDAEAAIACGLRGVLLDRFGRYADIEASYPRVGSLSELDAVIQAIDSPG